MAAKDGLDMVFPFALAGVAGASGWMFVHPFDVAKVQMQINPKPGATLVTTCSTIMSADGFRGLYAGLNFAMWRQGTYTTSRMGLYDVIASQAAGADGKVSPMMKMACGILAGSTAATACCPVEVGLVRSQADSRLPLEQRRNYRGLFDCVKRVSAEEGILTLWRGVGPTVGRGAVVSMTQLASYEQAKEMLTPVLGSGFPTFVTSAYISGFIYCAASLPLDITKTRIQNMVPDPTTGHLPYSGMMDALKKIPQREGFLALWKGFGPYFLRGGGHTVFMFLFKEKYTELYKYARGRS
jgi:solute carrier family 25 oxoglutarate transporter 11